MDHQELTKRMQHFPAAVASLLAGVSEPDARWKPPGGGWSILEIVNHLADEEHEDFRRRVTSTLEDPCKPWPPIDPEAAVAERGYNERDLSESLVRFAAERQETLECLASLEDPDWERSYQHPALGALRAGDVMASHAAHDALHLRQLARRLFELTERDASPYVTAYAGPWSA